jgi:uncharacterized membrane protein
MSPGLLEALLPVLTFVAALGCGLMAGVFFAFSTFVMKALACIPEGEGIAAMQSINRTVINPWFMGVFLGTAGLCAFLVTVALLRWGAQREWYLIAGSALYLVGTVLVTMLFNVPKNNELAVVGRADPRGSVVWPRYLATWTAWNHVRAAAALAAAVCLMLAL